MPNSWWFRLVVLLALTACAPIARADTTLSALGIRSLDGDDAMARRASVGLRTAAQKLPEVRVSERNVNLTQLTLAHGCEDADAAWSGVGLSVAMLGGAVYTWLAIDGINGDRQMIRYRELDAQVRAPVAVGNVCTDAEGGFVASRYPSNSEYVQLESHARSNCARFSRLNPLQYIFLTGSVAAAGLATYLFLTRPKKARALEQVQLSPQFGRDHGYLGASVRF
jgi:hypothetical protein